MPPYRSLPLFGAGLTALALLNSAAAESGLVKRGGQILTEMCSGCHSIHKTGQSPLAGAPAFREIDLRVDSDGIHRPTAARPAQSL